MLYEYLRVFKEAGGVFTDLSLDNQEEAKTLTPALGSSDYLYIGQYFPFNNLFFHIGDVANATSSSITIQYWDGTAWRSAVDILDATASSGVPLARSGVVQFSPDRDYGWQKVNDTTDSNAPSELSTLTIYELYWIRVKFNSGMTAGTEIKEVSYAFTDTQELNNIDIEINSFYDSFASGKTDWIVEIITASKMLIVDLKRQGLVYNKGQVLRFDDVFLACTYKTLELIYMNLGPSYSDKRSDIRNLYIEALNIKRFTIDKDSDGYVDRNEINNSIKRLVR